MSRQPRRSVLAVIAALMLVPLAPGCTGNTTSDRSLVFVDPAEGDTIAAGSRRILGGERTARWVDPRIEEEFESGHIPGALNVPFSRLSEMEDELHGYTTLIIYGRDFNDPKAEAMSKTLLGMGFKDVRTLKGGLRAWRDAGFEVEEGNRDMGNRGE